MKSPIYLVYGLALMSLVGLADYRGWSFLGVNEHKNVPKSMRDNPGAYRSHYMFYSRHVGGK